ncbi:hypothetical protein PGH07_06435 [Sulfurovum sp. zt1-1]|uniref:Uncharacterized protein n=1 Tax=Sulfurovum zhangzhouensis TaxID=3019067 RepID=A0ABT7QY98_9BACT|nr:hypothetical protein [Sulfurovum zhangzhouensis]MDM5271808.1 hypothetical protein [Sulfurovum zhangzhouensis]
MQDIIDALMNALSTEGSMFHVLNQNSSYVWHENYPVAVVHEKRRINDEKVISWMESEGMLDKDGFTPQEYSEHTISLMRNHAPDYLKEVSIMCLDGINKSSYLFKEKRPHDYWKKIENPGNLKAVVEISQYQEEDICKIESELRDLMRSSKEVPVLKKLGFVWMVSVPVSLDIEKLLSHYFLDKYKKVTKNEHTVYIGWSDSLNEVNMRYFVCPVA